MSSSFVVALDSSLRRADGTCELRLATATPGKHVTLIVKDGETITASDPETIRALGSVQTAPDAKVVNPLASAPAKPTYTTDALPKTDLPKAGAAK